VPPELVAVAATRLAGVAALSPSPATVAALTDAGLDVRLAALADVAAGAADAVVLLADELSRSGDHAEGLVADVARVLAPGGVALVGAQSALHVAANGGPAGGVRAYRADELERLLGHRGFAVELLCAPGAGSRLAGAPPDYQPALDRRPGLLDAAPRVVALGRWHADPAVRSRAFFATLPRKVVAAATVCRDEQGRLLVVHDSFKRRWTIPGGVVDADEDPRAGAERETWEEAGLRVRADRLLGLFTASGPDRLVLVYEAVPERPVPAEPTAVHAHEIDAVAWVPLPDALARLDPMVAEQVTRCLASPGGSWHGG